MREIDEVRVEGNVLTIFDTRGERHRFRMGVPEQVYDEIVEKLRPFTVEDAVATGRRIIAERQKDLDWLATGRRPA